MKALLSILALMSLTAACGDDAKSNESSDSTNVADSTSVDTTGNDPIDVLDPSSVKVYTSAEVCALVSLEVAASTLGVDVTEVEVSDLSTPQCFYNFTVDGTRSNLTLAVQRPIEDLGGAAGKAGFDVTTSLVIFDVPYEPLAGLGDEAAVSASETLTIVAVLADNQVFTIVTSTPIDLANLVAFGNAVVEGFSAPATDPTDAPSVDADALAEAKVQAALDTLPADWVGTIASDLGEEGLEGDDIVFSPCLGPDDYNLDNLDPDSAASWELDAEGPDIGAPTDGQKASVEARVFADEATAADAYAVLEKILGTDEGRECLANEVPGQLAADAPADAVFEGRVEGTTIEGADVGVRLILSFDSAGFAGEIYFDLVAARDGQTTIFATFTSFAAPIDQAVASAMVTAALATR